MQSKRLDNGTACSSARIMSAIRLLPSGLERSGHGPGRRGSRLSSSVLGPGSDHEQREIFFFFFSSRHQRLPRRVNSRHLFLRLPGAKPSSLAFSDHTEQTRHSDIHAARWVGASEATAAGAVKKMERLFTARSRSEGGSRQASRTEPNRERGESAMLDRNRIACPCMRSGLSTMASDGHKKRQEWQAGGRGGRTGAERAERESAPSNQ
jgi:hypothetical protein